MTTDGQNRAVFKYPGGKTRYADWILDHIPDHTCYVEPFGGAGSVLANKPQTSVEVYNDLDDDLVHFFRVLRDRPDELVAWLERTPFSRSVHKEFAQDFYHEQGHQDLDDVERAGRFFYLRYSQFGAKYDAISGFATSKTSSTASGFRSAIDRLDAVADRFSDVVIEALDFRDVFDKYDQRNDDGDGTVFYVDPPYVGTEGNYRVGGDFNHHVLVHRLADLKGDWVLSYQELPDGLGDALDDAGVDYWVARKDTHNYIRNFRPDAKKATERLVLNFDPEQTDLLTNPGQNALTDY